MVEREYVLRVFYFDTKAESERLASRAITIDSQPQKGGEYRKIQKEF